MKKALISIFLSGMFSLATVAQTFTNPVYDSDSPDPSIQRAQDGSFYCYATNCQTRMSKNLVKWSNVSGVFSTPKWNGSGYAVWASDVNFVDERYVMYYALALWGNTTTTGIGVAMGSTPSKFTDVGKMFRSSEIGVTNSIDPCYIEDLDKKYLVWGSFHDLYIAELASDGLSVKNFSKKTKIAGGAFEGVMIHKHKGYYYLFASVGSCCEGVNSTYKTVVGRATAITGPYLNKQGGKMYDNNYTTIIKGNDRWKGPGHNSEIITDDEGNDWILYHAYDAKKPDKGRVLMMDKIVWDKDGWPTVNDGTPSTTAQPAPVFYTGDGANITYKMRNMDFGHSGFDHWDCISSEDATCQTGQGLGLMPVLSIKGGSFDVSQTKTGLPNGLYEFRLSDYTRGNVEVYVNEVAQPANVNVRSATAATSASTDFISGKYQQSVYGLVTNGTLKIGMRSVEPMLNTHRFYAGDCQVIYREKNAEACQAVYPTYAHLADSLASSPLLFYATYRTRMKEYMQQISQSEDGQVSYDLLLKLAKTVDSVSNSQVYYDSLRLQLPALAQEIEYAKAHDIPCQSSVDVYAEAEQVIAQADYTDKQVLDLIARLQQATSTQAATFERGDGTADNPYVICRPEQLMNMRNACVESQMVYFQLGKDVDMEGYAWKQLNTSADKYRNYINFDGKGHLILHLTPADDTGYPSFFGTLCGECRNVGFVDAKVVSTGSGAGILAGFIGNSSFKDAEDNMYPAIVENCYLTGTIESKGYAAPFGGYLNYSPVIIRNCYTNVDITGTGKSGNYVGGLVGRVRSELTIQNSYSAGSVNGPIAGGVVAGGQSSTTPTSIYDNVIAWNSVISGTTASVFGALGENDQAQDIYILDGVLLNEQAQSGKTHQELQQIAAKWGEPWYSDPAAGNGYPILQWQYDRGDYVQYCGFPIPEGVEPIGASPLVPAQQAAEYYDLTGRRIQRPASGVVIEVRGGRSCKILLR